ncbi:hypothetical protein DEA98_07745 [Brucella pseudogrignonensis]|nr:hypothetical protein [Brucella pseudogrignonensis]
MGRDRCKDRKNDIREYTTVTKKLRRVGHFDPALVRKAIDVNSPSRVVLNHLDYVGASSDIVLSKSQIREFILGIEADISRKVDWFGFSPFDVIERQECLA